VRVKAFRNAYGKIERLRRRQALGRPFGRRAIRASRNRAAGEESGLRRFANGSATDANRCQRMLSCRCPEGHKVPHRTTQKCRNGNRLASLAIFLRVLQKPRDKSPSLERIQRTASKELIGRSRQTQRRRVLVPNSRALLRRCLLTTKNPPQISIDTVLSGRSAHGCLLAGQILKMRPKKRRGASKIAFFM
jgi:hypothetical protein